MTNPFEIPKKSSVIEGNRRIFRSRPKHFPQNLPPIVLDGSSKYPAPEMLFKQSDAGAALGKIIK